MNNSRRGSSHWCWGDRWILLDRKYQALSALRRINIHWPCFFWQLRVNRRRNRRMVLKFTLLSWKSLYKMRNLY